MSSPKEETRALEESLRRRLEKVASISQENGRQRKREYAAIGRLKKQIAAASEQAHALAPVHDDGPATKRLRKVDSETEASPTVHPENGPSRKEMKQIIKTVNHK